MTDWIAFNLIRDNMINNFFGDYVTFALVLSVLFLIMLVSIGIEFKYSIVFTLPIVGGFAALGYFGSFGWIVNALLIVIGLIYGFVLIKLYGG